MPAGGDDDVLRSLGFGDSGEESDPSESEDGSVDIDALLGGAGAEDATVEAGSEDPAFCQPTDDAGAIAAPSNLGDTVFASGINEPKGHASATDGRQPATAAGEQGVTDPFGVEGLLGDTSSQSADFSPHSTPKNMSAKAALIEAGLEDEIASSSDDDSVDVDDILESAQGNQSASPGPQECIGTRQESHATAAQVSDEQQDLASHGSHTTSSSEEETLGDLAVSLRTQAKARMQDPEGKTYYANAATEETSWEPPAAPAAPPAAPVLPEGWAAFQDPQGRTYYANAATGESAWEPPAVAYLFEKGGLEQAPVAESKTVDMVQSEELERLEERLRHVNQQVNEMNAKVAISRKSEKQRKQEVQDLRNSADQAERSYAQVEEKERRAASDEHSAKLEQDAMAWNRSREALLRTELSEMKDGGPGGGRVPTKQAEAQCGVILHSALTQTKAVGLEVNGSLSEAAATCIAQLQDENALLNSSWAAPLSHEDALVVLLEISKEKRKARHFVEDCSSTGDPVLDQLLRRGCAANALAHEEASLEAQFEALRQRRLVKTEMAQFDAQVKELRRRLALQVEVLQQFSECSLISESALLDSSPPPKPSKSVRGFSAKQLDSSPPPKSSNSVRGLLFSPESRQTCLEPNEAFSTDGRLDYCQAIQAVSTEFNSLDLLRRQETVAEQILQASELRSLHDELTSAVNSRARVEESLRRAEATRLDSAAKQRRQLAQASLSIRQSWQAAPARSGRGRDRNTNSAVSGARSGNRSMSSSRMNRSTSFSYC